MKLELTVPTDLSEIPLMHYQKFKEVCDKSNDEEFISNKTLEIMCGIELKDAVKVKASSLMAVIQQLNTVFNQEPKHQNTFYIKDIEFGFINKLEDMSWGEYIDLENYLSDWSTYHKALAVMYRPIKMKTNNGGYEIMEYNGTDEFSELMKYTPLNIALSSAVFFWTLEKQLSIHFLSYLESQMTNKTNQMILAKRHNLANSGDGIQVYIDSVRETLETSTKLRPSLSLKH
jgi:hypothetical protein